MNVVILYGGKSAEHEISIRSANNVFQNIDRTKYNPLLVKIDKKGRWLTNKDYFANNDFTSITNIQEFNPSDQIFLNPGNGFPFIIANGPSINISVDAIFPVLHGPNGEDGTVQGLLKILEIPFVGPSVLGSAIGMDKEVVKRLLIEANINIGKYLVARNDQFPDFSKVKKVLGLPVYVKPANMGSSVGISKVNTEDEYGKAIELAYQFDRKLIIEANIVGREIECAILGNENPKSSVPGEIVASTDFYDYSSKYLENNGSELIVDANFDDAMKKKIMDIGVKTFQVLECEGMARVDFFITKANEILINEINTIPGFTSISMYPKLWLESGLSYTQLISKLIDLAISRFKKEKKLITSIY